MTGSRSIVLNAFRGTGVVLAAVALGAAIVGCGSSPELAASGVAVIDESGQRAIAAATTTMQVLPEVSIEEQARADRMFAAALSDGVFSTGELERFALESVACAGRAGFEATMNEFEPDYRQFSFGVAVSGNGASGDEDAAALAFGACQSAFWDLAYVNWETRAPAGSAEEAVRLQQERDRSHLACLAEAGYIFADLYTAAFSDAVPVDLFVECGEPTYG
jgi:hypothetical protein